MLPPLSNPDPVHEVALRMAAQGEYAQAVVWLERALDVANGGEESRQLAGALAEVSRLAEAAGELEPASRALEIATRVVQWADLHCRLGTLRARRGRKLEARRQFDRALAINPRYRAAVVERALLDASEGRIAEAMETLRVLAAESAPAEPAAFQEGLEHLGEAAFEDAAPLLRRALDSGDNWLDRQLRAYQDLVARGEMAQALALLVAAIAERPSYPDLHLILGTHELQTGATDDAIESLARALALHPDYHAARVQFARALEALGDSPQAIEQLELVLAREPAHPEARPLRERLLARRRAIRKGALKVSDRS